MLDALGFLRSFGVIEPVQRADQSQVAGYASYSLEFDAFADYPALWLWFLHRASPPCTQHPCGWLWVACPCQRRGVQHLHAALWAVWDCELFLVFGHNVENQDLVFVFQFSALCAGNAVSKGQCSQDKKQYEYNEKTQSKFSINTVITHCLPPARQRRPRSLQCLSDYRCIRGSPCSSPP